MFNIYLNHLSLVQYLCMKKSYGTILFNTGVFFIKDTISTEQIYTNMNPIAVLSTDTPMCFNMDIIIACIRYTPKVQELR